MNIKIERGIPMKPRRTGLVETLRKMKPGDSFLIDSARSPSVWKTGNKIGMKMSVRRETRTQHRCWFIAYEDKATNSAR